MARLATYRYRHMVTAYPVKQFDRFTLRVEILGERRNKAGALTGYRVKFMQFHADGRKPGAITWVLPKNVTEDEAPAPIQREIRLPYKDD